MTITQIIIVIFSSSVLSAALTSVVNYYLTSVNYKNEYYKKLLDNRLEAYQNVYYFLSNIKTLIHYSEDNILTPYLFTNGIDNFDKVSVEILVPIKSSIWLSSDLSDSLTKLSVLLNKISNEANAEREPDSELLKLGQLYMEEIRAIRFEIETIVKRDFKNLHKIESFLK